MSLLTARSRLLAKALAVTAVAVTDPVRSPQVWRAPRAGVWLIKGRLTRVAPRTDDGIIRPVDIDISPDVMPTLGLTCFLSDTLAVEAILGSTRHEIRARGGTTDVAFHETWVLPPVVTVRSRPQMEGRVSPYARAGVNGMSVFDGDDRNGVTVDLDNGPGLILQAGADIGLKGPWSLKLDVRKIWFNMDPTFNGRTPTSDIDLDPRVVSVRLGRRFRGPGFPCPVVSPRPSPRAPRRAGCRARG